MLRKKPGLTIFAIALGALAVFFALRLSNGKAKELATKEEIAIPAKAKEMAEQEKGAIPTEAAHGENIPKMEISPEIAKLNAMQLEIAKLTDADIETEIESIRKKAQQSGLLKNAEDVNINDHPEAKDMLMRMALLRVEKVKRSKKVAEGGN